MLDRSCGNESVGQLNCPMYASESAVGDESSPRNHHRFTNWYGICRTGQSERVRASRSGRRIACIEHTELQFADRDDRKCHTFGQFRDSAAAFARDEDRRIQ